MTPLIRAFISYQNIHEKSITLENSLHFWPKSQAEALATELPIKKCVYAILIEYDSCLDRKQLNFLEKV